MGSGETVFCFKVLYLEVVDGLRDVGGRPGQAELQFTKKASSLYFTVYSLRSLGGGAKTIKQNTMSFCPSAGTMCSMVYLDRLPPEEPVSPLVPVEAPGQLHLVDGELCIWKKQEKNRSNSKPGNVHFNPPPYKKIQKFRGVLLPIDTANPKNCYSNLAWLFKKSGIMKDFLELSRKTPRQSEFISPWP